MKTVERLVKLGADLSIRDSNGVSMCNHTTEGRKLLLTERCGSLYISYIVYTFPCSLFLVFEKKNVCQPANACGTHKVFNSIAAMSKGDEFFHEFLNH